MWIATCCLNSGLLVPLFSTPSRPLYLPLQLFIYMEMGYGGMPKTLVRAIPPHLLWCYYLLFARLARHSPTVSCWGE